MQRKSTQKNIDFNEMELGNTKEYVRYAIDMERAMNGLQKRLAACTSPMMVAMTVMKAVAEFYEADWCGVLDVDMDLGMWTSYWWYSTTHGEMAPTKAKDLEMVDSYNQWFNCMKEHEPLVVLDAEDIRDSYPEEYATYQRLGIKSVIAVPFWMHSTGFFAVKNPTKYQNQTGMIRLLSYAIVTSLNEHRLMETNRLSVKSPRIASDSDVYISLLGELKITTSRGMIKESELNSPKICRLLVYLLLSRKTAVSPREIVDTIWSEEDAELQAKNIKGWVYRLHQAFSLISDHRLIESTQNGYRINPDLNIITDINLFDKKWELALKANTNEDKVDILRKLVDLYEGDLLHSASSEHWLLPTSNSYQYRYIGAISELMKVLWEEKQYNHIHAYANKALEIVPHNEDVHYWLVRSMCQQGHSEMARSELKMAQKALLEEDYEALLKRLELVSCLH